MPRRGVFVVRNSTGDPYLPAMSLGTSATLPLLRLNLLRIHSISRYKLLAFQAAAKRAHVKISVAGCVNVA
ncbi:uncharacterized protein LACBIDRAFT_309488 [Laccaria bicolor S238N-H82]|uniref:Predicted protein n=1 Tax=Laccaria bicolor (strain S238N-H82 / ATCC MYA-4686) TaxID=486041 RepID=B0DSF4_LACBS|nr:uncharacterized protein LACBIDRAFT_309488 [Laccaria bicolor S238N-H82]EDR02466.1 predicted protein [Laccaria bicolor S238N-H82]|eukprot:XP_001886829.1 predicted protein [Laccaria bicolor S238N-H82]